MYVSENHKKRHFIYWCHQDLCCIYDYSVSHMSTIFPPSFSQIYKNNLFFYSGLNSASHRSLNSSPLGFQNMTFFRNRIFADIIKVRIKKRAHWNRVGPKSTESTFIRERKWHAEDTRKKSKWRLRQRLELCCYKLEEAWVEPPGAEKGERALS